LNIQDIISRQHIGEIVDISDPKFLGRVKIDIKGIFSSIDGEQKIDFKKAGWFYPETPNQDSIFTPKVGNMVICWFDKDIYSGRYRSYEGISKELSDKMKEDYEGYKSIVFDPEEKLEIFYSRKDGVNIKYGDSIINITKDGKSIVASIDNGKRSVLIDDEAVSTISDKISHGSKGKSAEPSVLGDKQEDQLKLLWDAIDKLNTDFGDFTKVQSAVSVGLLSPLKAGYTKASITSTTNKIKIKSGKSKTSTILSKVNTLD
jgi:hypothetical protein